MSTEPPAVSGLGAGRYPAYGAVMVGAGDWFGGHGVDVKSNGSGGNNRGAWQCVELVERFVKVEGFGPGIYGNANQLYANAGSAYDRHPNGSGYIPVPGDIVTLGGGQFGHVVIVDSVTSTTAYVVEQNASASGRGALSLRGAVLGGEYGMSVIGVLHARANTNSTGNSTPLGGGGLRLADGARPMAATDSNGVSGIYWRGSDAALHATHFVNDAAGARWVTDTVSPGPMASDPTTATGTSGASGIYWRGTDAALHVTHFVSDAAGARWVTDTVSPGPVAGDPNALFTQQNGPLVYWRGTDGALHQTHFVSDAAGARWVTDSPSPGSLAGDPTATFGGNGVGIYWAGGDGALDQTHFVNDAAGARWVTDTPYSPPLPPQHQGGPR